MEQEQAEPTPSVEKMGGVAQNVKGEEVQFGPGLAVTVQGQQDLSMNQAGALVVAAGNDLELSYGGAMFMAVGGDAEITNGGNQVMVVGGDSQITNGGAQVMIAGGNVEITNGGGLLLAGQQVTAQKGFFGIVLTQKLNLEAGSKVLLDTPRAAVFGAVFGVVFALLSWVFKSKQD